MRGMIIFYRNGTNQIINTDQGEESAMIHFEQGDEFIGMSCLYTTNDNKKPRQMGLTILRNNGTIHETPLYGNCIGFYPQIWPKIDTFQGRQDVENMRIKKLHWSRWGSGDNDLSGIKLTNNQDQESPILGQTRYEWRDITLRDEPI